ncbi:MAG: cyclic nucleotide-binding domain-containing protein [Proteobacteria bacterium]|nr:cyclic nucleotide-binding domain-containing protein [Pseudomonadota bacterium]
MVSKEDFRNNNIFGNLTDDMLDKLLPLAEVLHMEARDFVFKEGDAVENLFTIKRGTVLIEQRISDKITVTAGTTTAGESFGFSSLFKEGTYSTNAVCADQCELIVINGEALMDLLKNDHSMGFYIMQNIAIVFGSRIQRRTEQFLRAMTSHPEIHELGD